MVEYQNFCLWIAAVSGWQVGMSTTAAHSATCESCRDWQLGSMLTQVMFFAVCHHTFFQDRNGQSNLCGLCMQDQSNLCGLDSKQKTVTCEPFRFEL